MFRTLPEYEKTNKLQEYLKATAGTRTVEILEPARWVTGVASGSHTQTDYTSTHVLVYNLTILRTDELREERGLTGLNEKPTAYDS